MADIMVEGVAPVVIAAARNNVGKHVDPFAQQIIVQLVRLARNNSALLVHQHTVCVHIPILA